MAADRCNPTLPEPCAGWMKELLGSAIPPETDATCEHCAMCPADERAGPAPGLYYDSKTQCCTYFPDLPNFLVGGILGGTSAAAAVVRGMVRGEGVTGEVVSPLGIHAPGRYKRFLRETPRLFGRDRNLRCPFHRDADARRGPHCGIWAHRQAMCCTWFCKYERGVVGRVFWAHLNDLLKSLEEMLAWWVVLRADPTPAMLRELGRLRGRFGLRVEPKPPADSDAQWLSPEGQRRLWGPWRGKEERFFKATGRLAGKLSWREILRIAGPGVEFHARLVKREYRNLTSRRIPARLLAASYSVLNAGAERTTVVAYSRLDPLDLPNRLLGALHIFDGRLSTRQALQKIRRERGVTITREMLGKLVDVALLGPAGESPPAK